MWRFRGHGSSFRIGCCIGTADCSGGFTEFFYFLVKMRVAGSDLGSERLVSAEFEELRNVNSSRRVEEQSEDLDNVTGVVLEQGASNITKILGRGSPFSVGVEKHFKAFEGFGFFFGLSVATPRGCFLTAMKQPVEGGRAAERCVIDEGWIYLRQKGAE